MTGCCPKGRTVAVEEGRQLGRDLAVGEEDLAGEAAGLAVAQADLCFAPVSGLICSAQVVELSRGEE